MAIDPEIIKPDITSVMSKHDISIEELIKCGKEGLRAERIIKDRDGDELDRIPDWNIRHKFFSSFLELLGYIKNNNNSTTVNVGFSVEDLLDRHAEAKRLASLSKN